MRRNLDSLSTGSGLGAILLWSATFAFARSLSEQVGPLSAGAAAYLIGGSLCLFRLAGSGRPVGHLLNLPRPYLLGCGSLFVFYTTAIYIAVGLAKDREQVLEIALVNYLWPTLTILFSLPLLKSQASLWLLPGTGLALTGVFLVMTPGAQVSWASVREHLQTNPVAYALALAAAISWALYSNLARRWSAPENEGGVELFVPAAGLVLLALPAADDRTDRLEPPGRGRGVWPGRHHHAGLPPLGLGHAPGQPLAGGRLLVFHAHALDAGEWRVSEGVSQSQALGRLPAARVWFRGDLAFRFGAVGARQQMTNWCSCSGWDSNQERNHFSARNQNALDVWHQL